MSIAIILYNMIYALLVIAAYEGGKAFSRYMERRAMRKRFNDDDVIPF